MQSPKEMRNVITSTSPRARAQTVRLYTASLLLLFAVLFVGDGRARTGSAMQDRDTSKPAQTSDTPAAQALLRARELFDEENWTGAAAEFEEFIAIYPQDKNIPAANYWLAVALKKQAKYGEADARLARLLKEFPRSNWAADARALRVEIAGLTRNAQIVVESASDENETVRLTALQSLLRIDPPRALKLAAELLRPDSGASLNAKVSALTLLGRSGMKEALPLLTQAVGEQTETKLRVAAIYALAQIDDAGVFDFLKGVASGSDNNEVAEAALYAVAHLPGERSSAFISELARAPNSAAPAARRQAILLLAQKETELTADELANIYDSATDAETRKQTLLALGLTRHPRAQAKLLEIARQPNADAEVRGQAILELGQRGDTQMLESLMRLYDAEKNEDVKEWVILALAQAGDKSAARKLMTIGKSDPSERLRQMAVLTLQRNSDPEVQRFLQELTR